jgi:hypothetical protein
VWLAEQVCPSELNTDRRREALLARCRVEKVESPTRLICDRMIASANRSADERFCLSTVARLSPEVMVALEALIAEDPHDEEEPTGATGFFTELKADDLLIAGPIHRRLRLAQPVPGPQPPTHPAVLTPRLLRQAALSSASS